MFKNEDQSIIMENMIIPPSCSLSLTVSLAISDLHMYGDGKKQIIVSDPTQVHQRKGQFFISMPPQLTEEVVGSTCIPTEETVLQSHIADTISQVQHINLANISAYIYHGSANPLAIDNSILAVKGYKDAHDRAQFQTNIVQLLTPIFLHSSKYDVRIIEDCIASGDSLIGIIAFLKTKIDCLNVEKIRIDVVVSTIQGIILLDQFAQQNNIRIDLHIGYLAYGLSRGEKIGETGVRTHANYITYPPEIVSLFPSDVQTVLESLRNIDGNIYVVGDMGDGARSLPHSFDATHPWNVYREFDLHGERGEQSHKHADVIHTNNPLHIFLSNGGFLVRSIYRYISQQSYLNEVVISAKRVWSDDKQYGYGVLIDDVKEELLTSHH